MAGQYLINGLVLGSSYALFALGFTLIFGVLRVLNLTYGFYFSAGAFAAVLLAQHLNAPLLVILPAGAIVAGLLAIVIDAALLTRLRRARAPELASLMVTLGGVLALYALMTVIFGTEIRRMPEAVVSARAIEFAGLRVTTSQILIVVTALGLSACLFWLLKATRLGLAIRALAENPDAALLMGIDAVRVAMTVSFLSGALGGTAGVLIGLNYNAIQPFMGEQMMLRGFAVIIVGGLGNLQGAVIAGLLLGVLEVFAAGYISSSFKDAVAFAALLATLWLRPSGVFAPVATRRA